MTGATGERKRSSSSGINRPIHWTVRWPSVWAMIKVHSKLFKQKSPTISNNELAGQLFGNFKLKSDLMNFADMPVHSHFARWPPNTTKLKARGFLFTDPSRIKPYCLPRLPNDWADIDCEVTKPVTTMIAHKQAQVVTRHSCTASNCAVHFGLWGYFV